MILSAITRPSIRAGFGIFYDPIRARTYASGYYFNPPYALAFVPLPAVPQSVPGRAAAAGTARGSGL